MLRVMESLNMQGTMGYHAINTLSTCNVRDRLYHAINEERFMRAKLFTDATYLPSLKTCSHYTIDFVFKQTPVLDRLRSRLDEVLRLCDNMMCRDYVNEIRHVFYVKNLLFHEIFTNFYLDRVQNGLDNMVFDTFQGRGTANVYVNLVFDREKFEKLRENGVSLYATRADYKNFLAKFVIFRMMSDFPDDVMFSTTKATKKAKGAAL
ncbi:hypothetical protein GUITHDRAFT_103564 [Guillardia theta CCMP2712]|uniref:Uncharacterized protein n=1 Tax=Guillardia theta (strain CCMP2712) TaxID=905079 RepID=L1JS15_GUITC|nr:hypothetical protein GUITHDRAFT_103564 [Guillardia theta CCMP2712]EKX50980.1 hypothetical protein GUITHDRAFT_103564 [Guillardia theta CCMP2712]|eukprot:XP_005837960.1 hypothetical protein GUITHDRAFT_103564 [Guillardia theta CCMP2712]